MGKGLLCFPIQVFCLVEFRNRFSRIEIWLRSIPDLFVDLACAWQPAPPAAGPARAAAREGPGYVTANRTWSFPGAGSGGLVRPHASVPPRPCRSAGHLSSALQAGLGPRLTRRTRCSCNAPPTLLVGAAKPDPGRRSSASQLCYASEKRLPGPLVRPEVAPGAPAAWRVSVSLTESSLTSAHPQAGLRGRPCGGRLAGRSQVYLTTGSGASTRPPTASTTGR